MKFAYADPPYIGQAKRQGTFLWVIEMLPVRTKHWQATIPAYILWKHARKEYLRLMKLKGTTQYRLKRYEASNDAR